MGPWPTHSHAIFLLEFCYSKFLILNLNWIVFFDIYIGENFIWFYFPLWWFVLHHCWPLTFMTTLMYFQGAVGLKHQCHGMVADHAALRALHGRHVYDWLHYWPWRPSPWQCTCWPHHWRGTRIKTCNITACESGLSYVYSYEYFEAYSW